MSKRQTRGRSGAAASTIDSIDQAEEAKPIEYVNEQEEPMAPKPSRGGRGKKKKSSNLADAPPAPSTTTTTTTITTTTTTAKEDEISDVNEEAPSGVERVFAPVATLVEGHYFREESDQRIIHKVNNVYISTIVADDPREGYKMAVEGIKQAIVQNVGPVAPSEELSYTSGVLIPNLSDSGPFEFMHVLRPDGTRKVSSMIQREAPLYTKDGEFAFAIYGRADQRLVDFTDILDKYGQQHAQVSVCFPLTEGVECKRVGFSTTTNQLMYQTYVTYVIEKSKNILHYFIVCIDRYRSIEIVVQLSTRIPPSDLIASTVTSSVTGQSHVEYPEYISSINLLIDEGEGDVEIGNSDEEDGEGERQTRMDVDVEEDEGDDSPAILALERDKLVAQAYEEHRKDLEQAVAQKESSQASNWLTQMVEENTEAMKADLKLKQRLDEIESMPRFASTQSTTTTHFHRIPSVAAHAMRYTSARPQRRVITTDPSRFTEMNANVFTKLGRRLKNFAGSAAGLLSTKGVMVSIDSVREAAPINGVIDEAVIGRFEDAAKFFETGKPPASPLPVNIKYVTIKSSSTLRSKYDRKNKPGWLSRATSGGSYKVLRLPLEKPLVFDKAGQSTIDIHIEEVQGKSFKDLDSQFLLSPEVITELQQARTQGGDDNTTTTELSEEEQAELTPEQQKEALLQKAEEFTKKNSSSFKGIAFLGRTRAVMMAVTVSGTTVTITDVWIVDASASS